MAWGDTSGQRSAAQKWTSENVPNYSGTAYGMNQGSSFYDPDMFNRTPEMGWSNMAGSEPYAAPSQGYDRSGSARGDLGGSNYRNIELANRRGIGSLDEDEGMGMLGHAKQFFGGFDFPSPWKYLGKVGESISKNQKQHRDLDQYFQSGYGDDWRKAKNASFWQGQGFGSASANQDMSLLSPQGRQAHGYFSRAGITDNDLDAFMNPNSKWFGNEAYLESVAGAEGAEAFKTGMSFLKNAADTSNLHKSVFGQRNMRDYEEGEHWDIAPDEDITSAISYGDPNPEGDILYGEPTGPGTDERVARGLSYAEPDMLDTLYGEPTPDPFGGMYESPLTDDFYNEQLIDKTPQRPSHSKHIFRPRDTIYPLLDEEDIYT